MDAVTFRIIRSSDQELVDTLREMLSDGEPRWDKIAFVYLSGGQFEVTPDTIANDAQLAEVAAEGSRVFGRVVLHYPQGTVTIKRQNGAEKGHDNTGAFDEVSLSAQHNAKERDVARLLSFVQQSLGKFSISGLGVYLGEESQKHFEARDIALARLEELATRLTRDLETSRQQQQQSLQAKEQELEKRFQTKEQDLKNSIEQNRLQLDKRAAQLDEREKSLSLQDAKSQRRKEREEFKTTLKEWSQNFEVTQGTRRLRTIIHALSVALLVVFGLAAGIYLYQSIQSADTAQLIAAAIKQSVFTALFVATSVFYARWNTHWFQKRANEEFRLKRMELDFNRASWFVELAFQWREDYKDQPLPPELVERLTTNLFVGDCSELPPQHPYETLGNALLGATARLKLGPAGAEVELDRKGIRELRKGQE